MTETPTETPGGRIEPIELQTSMQRAYIDYAMAVIVGRALPDVRDGLKPVHRRVLYAMYDGGYRPDRGPARPTRFPIVRWSAVFRPEWPPIVRG